jgi:site-specific recombinase XerD
MASAQQDIERFGAYLRRRNYAAHTIDSYTLDLRLFFVDKDGPPATVTHRDVEQFVTQQHDQGLSSTLSISIGLEPLIVQTLEC